MHQLNQPGIFVSNIRTLVGALIFYMRKNYFLNFSLLLLVCIYHASPGQNISTEGEDFWLGFMENHEAAPIELEIFISSNDTTAGKVEIPYYNWVQNFFSYPGTTAKVTVPTSIAMNKGSGIIANRGIHITAENPVSVYALNKRNRSSDATVVLPTISLGKEYYTMAHMEADGGGPSLFSEILIVAIEDETELQITPNTSTIDGKPANIPFELILDQGQTYQLQSTNDLTGTKIETINSQQGDCKAFAVYGGNEWTRIGGCGGAQDNLFEQMFPVNTWGKEFISVPYKTRLNGDIFKIMASEDSTVVTVNDGSPYVVNKGRFISLRITNAAYIKADKPISVGQFSRSQSCDRVEADPFFIMLSPVEQRLKSVTFNALEIHVVDRYYLNIVVPASGVAKTELNGINISGEFSPVTTNEDYHYAQIDITEGNHTIECDDGFIAYVYGYGDIESFGYATGVSLQNLNLKIESGEPGSEFEVRKDSTCIEDPVEFTVDGDSSFILFEWDFGDGNTASGKTVTHQYEKEGIYPVTVTANTSQGACSSEETSRKYMYVVKPVVDIYGPRSVCPNVTQIEYRALGDARNTYKWYVEGGTITSSNDANSVIVDWGPTNDSAYVKLLPTNYLGCIGDTLDLLIKINVQLEPSAPFGADTLCSDLASDISYEAYLANGSIYDWHIDKGEIIAGQGTNISQVSWSNPGIGKLWFEESSTIDNICAGWSDTLSVYIERAPDENITIQIPEKLHYNDDTVLIHVSADPAFQYYSWNFGDGMARDSIPRNDDTLHIYTCNGAYPIEINAYTSTVCQNLGSGSKLVEIHKPELEMLYVSNDTASIIKLDMAWRYTGSAYYKQPVQLWRKQVFPEDNGWQQLRSFSIDVNQFTDDSRTSDSTIYEYKVETNHGCSDIASSLTHNNILLSAQVEEADSSMYISWNEYTNWLDGVQHYEVWQNIDNEGLKLIGELSDLENSYPYEYDGFDFCYRIKAIERSGNNTSSWSNESCVSIVPSIRTYNFFTPNNDAYNQYLTFDRVELYKNSKLTIFNRYGSIIREFDHYQNDWNGSVNGQLLQSGTYYYTLELNDPRNELDLIRGYFTLMY